MISLKNEQEELLRLSAVPGIGPNKMRALVGHFRSVRKVSKAPLGELCKVAGIDQKIAEDIRTFDGKQFAREQVEKLESTGSRLVTFWDDDYPKRLKEIYDPPVFLFVKGDFAAEDSYSIAIVGTRLPSNYGKRIAEKLTSGLSRKGLTIVSGLAYGVDTLAHRHALQNGSRTIAVLGSGVDVIYPNENRALAKKIASNGVLLSEFPLGTGPDRTNFPRRNRIICGLSLGIVVIEAGIKSGALITASMALDQNREVFAVPGNIDSAKSFGTNELIKQGAKVVTSVEDILDELQPQLAPMLRKDTPPREVSSLTEAEKALFDILTNEPRHIDEIASSTGQSTSRVLSTLLSLELKDLVKQHAGKLFVRL